MKQIHISILIACLLTASGSLGAQNYQFGLTVGGGITNAQLTNIPAEFGISRLYYPLPSWNVNAYIGYAPGSRWGVSVEPGWIVKGGVMHRNQLRDQYRLHYLQLPILANYHLTPRLTLSVGPEFAYLLKGTFVGEGLNDDVTSIYSNRLELSGLIGLSYRITKNLESGARYNHGITNLNTIEWSDENGTVIGKSKLYNQYAQLFIRFTL